MNAKRDIPGTDRERTYIIAIDGRAAAGKTTLAQQLAAAFAAPVIHMDDFFLPPQLRTESRLGEAGGNVHYERFREEVLEGIASGKDFSYRKFDCSRMALTEVIPVETGPVIIVEGSYSHHPCFGDYADLRIFKDIAADIQMERIRRRNGEISAQVFRDRWIPLEEKYFEAFRIREKADILL